jgi:hypothetical protein
MNNSRYYKNISDFYTENDGDKNCLNYFVRRDDNDKNMNYSDFPSNKENFEFTYEKKKTKNTSSPDVFGPPMWFSLHNGASKYPDNPSPVIKQRMKYFIIGLPIMVPCTNCREHATMYIEKNLEDLDVICSNRKNLFNFFVDFHNYVNKRVNKPIMDYSDAEKLYYGEVEIKKLNYK